jgi:uncharacterized protein YbaR (Trm112 family)
MSAIESWLREILRCPACRSTLRDVTGPGGEPELACTGCSLAYRIEDGIPVLLVDEARDRDADGRGRDAPAGDQAGADQGGDQAGADQGGTGTGLEQSGL